MVRGFTDTSDEKKKEYMVRAATYYLKDYTCFGRKVRFGVLGIDNNRLKIVWHPFIVEEGPQR